jgi:DNA-binding GntR family transcriptional regulator
VVARQVVKSVVAKPAKKSPQAAKRLSPEAEIQEAIHEAIAERQLPPGTKLAEDQLAGVFGVTRARIRSVLQALARDKVVTLLPNRGAFVAQPSVKEAREVFAARRLIEVALTREAARFVDGAGLNRLRRQVEKEKIAQDGRSRRAELKASHEFHAMIAEIAGNSTIQAFVEELLLRSALITSIFERPMAESCSCDVHERLIDLMEKRDEAGLAAEMEAHLEEIESRLALFENEPQPADLKSIFSKTRR